MNIGNIEIDEQKIKNAAINAALQVAEREVENLFQRHWLRENPRYDRVCKCVQEVIDELIASPEFKATITAACKEEFLALAKQKIANAVARTSTAKLRGE